MSRTHTYPFLGVLALVLLMHAQPVVAATDFIGTKSGGQLGASVQSIMSWFSILNTFSHIMILMTLNFAQYLIQADFFTNPSMMAGLNKIWQLSRDIMNVLFALMLVGVALYTIVTANKKFVTEKLATFVIAVILVNFSWFFPRVIIDVANILTGTIFSIPQIIGGYSCNTFGPNGVDTVPCKVIVDFDLFKQDRASFGCAANDPDCSCSIGIGCYRLATMDAGFVQSHGAGHAMINALVVNFGKILNLSKVPNTIAGPNPSLSQGFFINLQIVMSVMVSFVIQLAFLLPLIGLVIGLFLRIIILWVTTAFMPFTFLGYVINGKLGTNVFGFEVDVWKEFIAAAFLPAMVAVPITIGFVMLTTVVNIPAPANFPQMSIPLIYGVKSWWAMLWIAAAVGIMWKGAFAALKKSEFVGSVTEKVRGFGEYIFGAAIQVPLIVPLPVGGGKFNLGTAVHAPKIIADTIRLKASGTTSEKFGDILGKKFGGGATQADVNNTASLLANDRTNTQKIVTAIDQLKNNTGNKVQLMEEIRTHINVRAGATNDEVLERLKKIAETNRVSDISAKMADIQDLIQRERTSGAPPAAPRP